MKIQKKTKTKKQPKKHGSLNVTPSPPFSSELKLVFQQLWHCYVQGGMSYRQIHGTRVKKEPIPIKLIELIK